MVAESKSDNIQRFVKSARQLIVIQVVVAIIALGAGAFATYTIFEALKQRAAAKVETQIAQDATLKSQHFMKLASSMRPVLQAETREDYAKAADSLAPTVELEQDEDFSSLVATAYYKSAPEAIDPATRKERFDRITLASAYQVQAIQQNASRVAGGADEQGNVPTYASDLYLEFAAMQCAWLRSAGDASKNSATSEDLRSALGAAPLPDPVKAELSKPDAVSSNRLVMRECGKDLTPVVIEAFGLERVAYVPPVVPADDPFAIKQIYLQFADEGDRALASAIKDAFPAAEGPVIPEVEKVRASLSDYRPSVRYYHAEQKKQAEVIRDRVVAVAKAQQVSWDVVALPVIDLGLTDARRDTVEVWLPKGRGAVAVAEGLKGKNLLDVVYFQRPADGLMVRNVLDNLVGKDGWRIGKTQIAGDRNDALTCHEKMTPEMFAQFKTLALALLDAGMPIKMVKSYEAPGRRGENEVQVLHEPYQFELLTRADLETQTKCPARGLSIVHRR